jgi:hypothetical protein
MATEFRVVPVEFDAEGGLTLAMADPSDNHAVDEVAFFADRFVIRAVASESAIRMAIEKHYATQLSGPATVAAAAPRPVQRMTAVAPKSRPAMQIPTEPAAPERGPVASPRATYTEPPASEHEPVVTFTGPEREPEEAPEEAIPLTNIKHRAPAAAPPAAAPVPAPAPVRASAPAPAPAPASRVTPAPEPVRSVSPIQPILPPDPPLRRLRASTNRDEIAAATLDYMAHLMRRTVFFVVKKSLLQAFGVRAHGFDTAQLNNLALEIDQPSIFRDVISSRLPYRGPLPHTPANAAFAAALGGVGSEIILMPIAVRDRIIAVIFGESPLMLIPDAALHATIREAGLAYERVILAAKAGR